MDARYDSSLPESRGTVLTYSKIHRTASSLSSAANWHDDTEIQYITAGGGFVLCDGRRYEVEKGDIFIAASRVIHYTGTAGSIDYDCIIVSAKFLSVVRIDPLSFELVPVLKNRAAEKIIEDIKSVYSGNDRFKSPLLAEKTAALFITLLKDVPAKSHNRDSAVNETVKNAVNYINRHYAERITLDTLAKTVYKDKYSLSREFKKLTGQTVVEYINFYRTEKAKDLLQNGVAVGEAAAKCGFNNLSFFSRVYKKYKGVLPSKEK